MPALLTHNMFGRRVLQENFSDTFNDTEEIAAFILGNQGPDPLFFRCRALPSTIKLSHKLGSLLHRQKMSDAFLWLRRGIDALPEKDRKLGFAFALGYLGHYVLDREAHPYIYANQYAICGEDKDLRSSGNSVHAIIESDIDSALLKRFTDTEISDIVIKDVLEYTERITKVAGALLSQAIKGSLNIEYSADDFTGTVKDMRLIYSKIEPLGNPWSEAIKNLEQLSIRYSKIQALAHRQRSANDRFLNLNHVMWHDPCIAKDRDDSFLDLFESAVYKYRKASEIFIDNGDMATMTRHVNFDGDVLDEDEIWDGVE